MKRVALVCTRGFADVLTLGRQDRADPYALHVPASPWLRALPEDHRFEVRGRIDAQGREADRLTTQGLVEAVQALPQPPECFAVSLLFAHRNPAHEDQVRALLREAFPDVPVHCSHEQDDAGGEYERTVATLRAAGCELPTPPARPHPADPFAARVEAIADGMQQVLAAKAAACGVREAMDCAAGVFLPDGRLLAQARSVPLLLGSLAPAVQGLLAEFPLERMQPGDGFLSNDPWRGGTHLPDFVLLRPVFAHGRVQALAACILHHADVGGLAPGSAMTEASSIHHEGLRIPPVRLYRGGRSEAGLLRLLCANSRTPDQLAGDLRAQWSALCAVDEALQELLATPLFHAQAEAALRRSEQATRAALRAAPDGQWRFADALDGDGLTPQPVRVEVVLRKHGDRLTVDLTNCAGQTPGPVNAARAAVWSAVAWFARVLAPSQASANAGCLAPLVLQTAPGTVVDPAYPAAVNARTNLVKLLANALVGAWAQALPERMPAPNAGVAVLLSLAGARRDGTPWQFTEVIASAAGGAPWGSGASGVSTDLGNARNTPAESIEQMAPIRVEQVAVRRGSGGAGRHAGGHGVARAYRLLEGQGTIVYRGERHAIPAPGAAGGGPGACGTARIERPDGTMQHLPVKARAQWFAGDLLVIETAGAGGWGAT